MSRSTSRKPTHPGAVFKADILVPLGLSVTSAAKAMGVSRKHLSLFVNGRASCGKELALRIATATGTSAISWLSMQNRYDVWEIEHSDDCDLKSICQLSEIATLEGISK
ncbi:HigA family addiction module antitoxin [Marinobacterium sp. BA1]|uniref:HigA family addiction module antitoxin n=1 Tax=Marinobacterium sp. BA1 TaxID=3138931 RepID=UPI0032E7F014